jgi:DnaD/phage-associated family protein
MNSFAGFSEGRSRPTPIPAEFFNSLLLEIDTLEELRLTLYVLRYLEKQESAFLQFRASEIGSDPGFMRSFSEVEADAQDKLNQALQKAVSRGTFLKADSAAGEPIFFLNSPRGQAGLRALQSGKLETLPGNLPPQSTRDNPNIFRLYEENIGPLTPLIAEDLRAAEQEYPENWIEEAFRLAVQRNARSWRYIAAVLKRWKEEGRDGKSKPGDREDRLRYKEWENG